MEEEVVVVPEERQSRQWTIAGSKVPREEIEYFCTFFVILLVVITGLVNLCLPNSSQNPFWISLVTIGLSSVLPRAKIRKKKVIDGEKAK